MSVERIRGKVLIDTNVLIYATLSGDSRHDIALDVLNLRSSEDVEIYVSVQNLAEMYPNLTGPKNKPSDSPEIAHAKIRSLAALSRITILPVTMETVNKAMELCRQHNIKRQDYFDMQILATMQMEGISTIVTENSSDFEMVEGIRVVNPFAERKFR